jgi:hypothetical protein
MKAKGPIRRRPFQKKTQKKHHAPYKRKVHIDGEEWTWEVSGYGVYMCDPTGMIVIRTDIFGLHGCTEDEWYGPIEYWCPDDDTQLPRVTPGLVKEFIIEWLKENKAWVLKPVKR